MTISNIHELKDFLLSNKLTQKEKCELINKTLNVWIKDESKVDESKFKTKYKLLGIDKELDEKINITDYDVIVSGGRGIGGSGDQATTKAWR